MTRADKIMFTRLGMIVCAALGALFLIGIVVLQFNPATDLDRKCLHKPLAEIGGCINEYHNAKQSG